MAWISALYVVSTRTILYRYVLLDVSGRRCVCVSSLGDAGGGRGAADLPGWGLRYE